MKRTSEGAWDIPGKHSDIEKMADLFLQSSHNN